MRRFLPALSIALLFPLVAHAAPKPSTAQQEVAAIEKVVPKIRGLQQLHPVRAVFSPDKQFNAALDKETHELSPDSEIAIAQRESVVLGLIKKNDDLKHILFDSVPQDVLGFYSYLHQIFYLRTTPTLLGPMRFTIAHEFTHVLQDQHYHLRKFLPDMTKKTYRNSDMVSARHALTEGDADLVESLYVQRTYNAAERSALARLLAQPQKQPVMPVSITREVYWPYTYGDPFVARLYRMGGMRAVDAAYARPPQSSYEVMHPAAYDAHWKPATVTMHAVQGFSDWEQVDDDVFGAQGYQLVLWQLLSKATADSVVNGYRGDRYIFLEKGDQNLLLLKSVWKTSKAAQAARSAFLKSLKARYPGAKLTPDGTTLLEADGAVYLKSAGNTLTVAYAPTQDLAQQAGAAPTT